MNPMVKFNGTFVAEHNKRSFGPVGSGSLTVIPTMVVVTGHKGFGGNLGVNGIYTGYPAHFQGHPVFMKNMEKRAEEDEAALPKADRKPSRLSSTDGRKPSR